ncbi:MAG: glycosyltransferase family A protein, partial [bacterium]
MTAMGWACLAACGWWAGMALVIRRHVAGLRSLGDEAAPEPAAWPRLSVLVPACNEADTLEPALETLLRSDYPDLEVILVDDRSTDGTGAVVDRLAARDARIVPVHVAALPPGWLGKVHAMHVALPHATGEWLLFSDADVHAAPDTIRRAVA